MPGKTIVEPLKREGPAGCDQSFLAMAAFLVDRGEFRQFGKDQPRLLGLVDRDAVSKIEHGGLLRLVRVILKPWVLSLNVS
jgi:hypothetical protein